MWVLTWLTAPIKTVGGARERSNFLWMAIPNSPPLTAPAPKIIFADRMILTACTKSAMGQNQANIQSFAVLIADYRRYCGAMAITRSPNALACTAGTLPTPFGLR